MDEQTQAIITAESKIYLGVLEASTPTDIVERASGIATALARVVDGQKLYSIIRGKKFVHVDGWETLGAMLGIVAREVPGSIVEHENGDFEASVELIRVNDGRIIGFGSALCGCDETDSNGKPTWGSRARYARRSMAVTRAAGKAFRLSLSWIMKLAGYESTPAEEMEDRGPRWTEQEKAAEPTNGKTWPIEVIAWARSEWEIPPQAVIGALKQSNILTVNDSVETIKHWLKIRKTERDNGIDSAEATIRADADLQAMRESK